MTVSTAVEQPTSTSTWPLVQRAQQGDAEAFGQIYDLYVSQVYRYILFRVGGARELAEDLTADTFYRALKGIHGFTWQGREIANWLFTIAGRLIIDYFKSAHRRLSTPVADMPPAVAIRGTGGRDPESDPAGTVADYLSQVEMIEAVKALDDDQAECIILRFLMGRTVLETAQIMGKREGAIKSLTYRAVRTLRDRLAHLAPTSVA